MLDIVKDYFLYSREYLLRYRLLSIAFNYYVINV